MSACSCGPYQGCSVCGRYRNGKNSPPPIKLKPFTIGEILRQDGRDKIGELTCMVCEDVVAPADHESHVVAHNNEGWKRLA